MRKVGAEGIQLVVSFSSNWIQNQMRESFRNQINIYQNSDLIDDEGQAGDCLLISLDQLAGYPSTFGVDYLPSLR